MITAAAESGSAPYVQTITIRHHQVITDEGEEHGAADTGPTPSELLLGALASCMAVTVQMYARRKEWPVTHVRVEVSGRDEQGTYVIERRVSLDGDLTDEQRTRLLDIAGRCPVSRRLTTGVTIRAAA
ncbi:MAG: OsmC family protein [Vicinamibacterales bacterium]